MNNCFSGDTQGKVAQQELEAAIASTVEEEFQMHKREYCNSTIKSSEELVIYNREIRKRIEEKARKRLT